jgi:hypothetical protein
VGDNWTWGNVSLKYGWDFFLSHYGNEIKIAFRDHGFVVIYLYITYGDNPHHQRYKQHMLTGGIPYGMCGNQQFYARSNRPVTPNSCRKLVLRKIPHSEEVSAFLELNNVEYSLSSEEIRIMDDKERKHWGEEAITETTDYFGRVKKVAEETDANECDDDKFDDDATDADECDDGEFDDEETDADECDDNQFDNLDRKHAAVEDKKRQAGKSPRSDECDDNQFDNLDRKHAAVEDKKRQAGKSPRSAVNLSDFLSDSDNDYVCDWINPAAERAAAKKPVSEHALDLETLGHLAPDLNSDELFQCLSKAKFNIQRAADDVLSSKPSAKGVTASKRRPRKLAKVNATSKKRAAKTDGFLSDSEDDKWVDPKKKPKRSSKGAKKDNTNLLNLETLGYLAPHLNSDELFQCLSEACFSIQRAVDDVLNSKSKWSADNHHPV